MKRLLCLIGGVLLTAFSLLCFFEFFLAWNQTDGWIAFMAKEQNGSADLSLSYPLNEYGNFFAIGGHQGRFTLEDMLAAFLGEKSEYGTPTSFLVFSREDWLQCTIFSLIAFMLIVKFFKSRSSNKALGLAFSALAILAAWVMVKDFVEQWRYMFSDNNGVARWERYWFENREPSKTRVMINMALYAIPQLLLIFTFASMASVVKAQRKKSVFAPVFFAILHAGVTFAYNMKGIGFAVNWGLNGALVFLVVDALLVLGLLFTGIAVRANSANR